MARKSVSDVAPSPAAAAAEDVIAEVLVENGSGEPIAIAVDVPATTRQHVIVIAGVGYHHVSETADGRWVYRRLGR